MPAGAAALDAWVDAFWSFEGQGGPHRVLPDGCMDLLFELDSGRLRLVGPMTRAELVHVGAAQRLFGVRFRPGRAARFLALAADELADCDVLAQDVLGAPARRLADAVASASSDAARVQVLAEFIRDPTQRRSALDLRLERALGVLQQRAGAVPIAQVVTAAGVGERQLERLFRQRVGLRPKLLGRILRLQRTLELAANTGARQVELAASAGYADQAHLVREFRALCGVSPGDLQRERDVGFVQAQGGPDAACCPP